MITFAYRDARLERVTRALAALNGAAAPAEGEIGPDADGSGRCGALTPPADEAEQRRSLLEAELARLTMSDWRVSDRTYTLVAEDWLWSAPPAARQSIEADPAALALGETPKLTEEMAVRVETLERGPGDPPPDFMERVRAAVDGDEAVLAELIANGHRLWLGATGDNTAAYVYDDVAVMLPLRLETVFEVVEAAETSPDAGSGAGSDAVAGTDSGADVGTDAGSPQREKLLLRVVPDEASVCRDNPMASESELAFLRSFWQEVFRAVPDPSAPVDEWLAAGNEQLNVSWERLCRQVGLARSAWLAAAFPPAVQGGAVVVEAAAERIGEAVPNRIGGLPLRLDVWAVHAVEVDDRGAPKRLYVGTLQADGPEGEAERTSALRAVSLPESAESVRSTWWANWDQAKRIGLGGEWVLPAGWNRSTLQALYVVGVCDEPEAQEPGDHFRAQADAGELGLLRLGAPTNSVHGAPAADLAKDAAAWLETARWRLRQRRAPLDVSSGFAYLADISRALSGDEQSLPYVPGGSYDAGESQRFVRALWPSLWGHYLRDMWGLGDDAHQLGLWAGSYLYPEGPLSPIRIADQPYGLLPVTSLSQWESKPNDQYGKLEDGMARQLTAMRYIWARAAESRGTSFGADTERLIELLGRDALTATYIYRYFLSTELLALAYSVNPLDVRGAAEPAYKPIASLMEREPHRFYLAAGHPSYLHLPLVAATRSPAGLPLYEMIENLLKWDNEDLNYYLKILRGILPDSLLVRLMIHSLMLSQAWYGQSVQSDDSPLLELVQWDDDTDWPSFLDQSRQHFWPLFEQGAGKQTIEHIIKMQLDPLFDLAKELDQWWDKAEDPYRQEDHVWRMNVPEERLKQLERAFRATLDTATHRIDPWMTGIAWRRVQQHVSSPRRNHRLGAYGWSDGPFVGQPGPTAAGRLHAPSHPLALTSIVLRDKFMAAAREGASAGGKNTWEMNLDSERVRTAVELAEEVRLGFHLYEVLGRWVEGIVGTHEGVRKLRETYPMRTDGAHPNEACNGLEALNGLLADGAGGFALTDAQRLELAGLQQALDAYGDLLVADAVHQVVTGRPEAAAETMDAAAGFSRPPTFESVRTPPSGYLLHTSVLSALPWIAPPGDAAAHPCRIAEPSLMAYVDAELLDRAGFVWQAAGTTDVMTVDAPVVEQRSGSVALTDLGFTIAEAAMLAEDMLADIVAARLGIDRLNEVTPPPHYSAARKMIGALSGQPSVARAVSADGKLSVSDALPLDDAVRADLLGRLELLKLACADTVAALAGAADDEARLAALRRALQWGVVPTSDPAERRALAAALFGSVLPEAGGVGGDAAPGLLAKLANAAGETLQNRLKAVPADGPALTDIPDLARVVSELATQDAKLPVLARWETASLRTLAGLELNEPDAALDRDWLAAVAAVRAPLARLEALQLQAELHETFAPLTARTNAPGDPWRKQLIAANKLARASGRPTDIATPRFIAAYSAPGAWQADFVAVGLIDQFSESIPMPQRTTFVSFGFNAPAARAPQAILLAVPPKDRTRLEGGLLLDIVAETREQAHARAARPEHLDELQGLTSSLWFQGSGPDRVRLDRSSQYWR